MRRSRRICFKLNPDASNHNHCFALAVSGRRFRQRTDFLACHQRSLAATAISTPTAIQALCASTATPSATQARPPPGQPPAQAQAPAQNTPAPYDHDLQRLSEILGALHFLRAICGSNEAQKWRNEAQTLIEAEAPAGERRDQMIASFNRGYRAFQQSYRTCTPAADFVIRRYLVEGAKIAREITARYAN